MRRSRLLLSVAITLGAAAGCTSILGDFTVGSTANDGGGGGGGGDGGSLDGASEGGGGEGGSDASADGASEGGADGASDGGAITCQFFDNGKLLAHYTVGDAGAGVSDFTVVHASSNSDTRDVLLLRPNGATNSAVTTLNVRMNQFNGALQTIDTLPNENALAITRTSDATIIFTADQSNKVLVRSIADTEYNQLSRLNVISSVQLPPNTGNKRLMVAPVDDAVFDFLWALDKGASNWELYSTRSMWRTLDPPSSPFLTNTTNPAAVDSAGLFRAIGGRDDAGAPIGATFALLAPFIDTSSRTAPEVVYQFGLSPNNAPISWKIHSAMFYPVVTNASGGMLDLAFATGVDSPPITLYTARIPADSFPRLQFPAGMKQLPSLGNDDQSPFSQFGHPCVAYKPGTMVVLGRGGAPTSNGVNVFVIDMATGTFAAKFAGTGTNLLPGNDKFGRCAAVWSGDTTSGSHYDVFWTQPTQGAALGNDDIYYSQLYCGRP